MKGTRRVYFEPEVLIDIMRHEHADRYRFANPLPADAELVRYGVNMERNNRLCLVVSSAEFDESPDHLPPVWDAGLYEVNNARKQADAI
jgi:hypothetical protein